MKTHKLILPLALLMLLNVVRLSSQSIPFEAGLDVHSVFFLSPNPSNNTGWINILNDDGSPLSGYSTTETWDDSGTRKPAAYVSGNTPLISTFLKISCSLDDVLYIRGETTDNLHLPIQQVDYKQGYYSYAPSPLSIFNGTSYEDYVFANNQVRFYENFEITWYVSLDPELPHDEWGKIPTTTSNPLYITHSTPSSGMLLPNHNDITQILWSVLHIGCKAADSEDTEASIVDAIYLDFQDQEVYTYNNEGPLTYWGYTNIGFLDPTFTASCRTVSGLLTEQDAACGEMAQLFEDILHIQGITSSNIVTIFWNNYILSTNLINDFNDDYLEFFLNGDISIEGLQGVYDEEDNFIGFYAGFLVNNWDIESNDENFILGDLVYTDGDPTNPTQDDISVGNGNTLKYRELDGIAGQGNENPRSAFENHAFVKYSNEFYDPSYGTNKTNSKLEYENAAISAFSSILYCRLPNNELIRVHWVANINDDSEVELTFYPE